MTSKNSIPEYSVLQAAAEWFAVLGQEQVTDTEQRAWQTWIDQCSEHRQAWYYVEMIQQDFVVGSTANEKKAAINALEAAQQYSLTRRQLFSLITLTPSFAVLGWATLHGDQLSQFYSLLTADQRTGVGEIRNMVLDDGTSLWLNTRTAVNINYTDALRRISIIDGEILIHTGYDTRPFIVETRQGSLRPLGTEFSVHRQDNAICLAVYAGAVEIQINNAITQIIKNGEQTHFDRKSIAPVQSVQSSQQAWTKGTLVADNMLLGEFIAQLSRYSRVHFNLDPAIARLQVMGTYSLAKPDQILTMLENVLPIKIHKILPWWINITPRE